MARQDHMAHMIQRHVPINAILRKLIAHDASSSIIDEHVQPISLAVNLRRHIANPLPITEITLDPDGPFSDLLPHVLGDGVLGPVDDFLADAEDEHLLGAPRQERVGAGVPDAFGAAGNEGDFVGLVGYGFEAELVGAGFLGAAAEVLGYGVLLEGGLDVGKMWGKRGSERKVSI